MHLVNGDYLLITGISHTKRSECLYESAADQTTRLLYNDPAVAILPIRSNDSSLVELTSYCACLHTE